jgi:hypothetical protein
LDGFLAEVMAAGDCAGHVKELAVVCSVDRLNGVRCRRMESFLKTATSTALRHAEDVSCLVSAPLSARYC